MRSSRSSPPSKQEQEDVVDRIGIMLNQETSTYACQDYLLRRKLEMTDDDTVCSDDCPELVNEVDTLCREKMCEWSYRVIDHFHASREIVAISFAYLDRFVNLCSCDRNAFKLAAMTCLYMATKLFNWREISMRSLAELSRGEFDMAHIAEMEGIILKTLSWRLHPPTTQCFINALYGLLPSASTPVTRAICQRATFFAELSLFDYCFVTQPRSAIALATLLNAMEGMDETVVSKRDQRKFVKTLRETVKLEHSEEKVESIRNRLWYIYSQSVQYQADSENFAPTHVSECPVDNHTIKRASSDGELSQSPVSVRER
jgi:lipoyl(octanoyl) transferase